VPDRVSNQQTWFDYAPENGQRFKELVGRLRDTPCVAVVVSAGAGAVVAVGGAAPFAIVSVTSIEKQPARPDESAKKPEAAIADGNDTTDCTTRSSHAG
jgi:hypothetical protein